MKLLAKTDAQMQFHLSGKEQRILMELLKLYPALPDDFQSLSKNLAPGQKHPDQELLEESLAEQKAANRALLQKFQANPERFRKVKDGVVLTLEMGECDWILQVLNDIRVGSWCNAGSPDEQEGRPMEITEANLKHLYAMEVAGAFQSHVLDALEEEPGTSG